MTSAPCMMRGGRASSTQGLSRYGHTFLLRTALATMKIDVASNDITINGVPPSRVAIIKVCCECRQCDCLPVRTCVSHTHVPQKTPKKRDFGAEFSSDITGDGPRYSKVCVCCDGLLPLSVLWVGAFDSSFTVYSARFENTQCRTLCAFAFLTVTVECSGGFGGLAQADCEGWPLGPCKPGRQGH